jgi:hypothetical protein
LASQLLNLKGLRTLTIDLAHIQAPCSSAGAAALVSTLQQLTGLTQLTLDLGQNGGHRMPAYSLSSLSQLRSVAMIDVGTAEQPLELITLPGSLTTLYIVNCDVSYADNSSSASAPVVQLPLLRMFGVWRESTDNNLQHVCKLLRGASALREFKYMGDCGLFLYFTAGAWSQLLRLQRIELLSFEPTSDQQSSDPQAARLWALTSSSQFTSIELGFWQLPAGAVQQLFPAERQLPRLQELIIGRSKAGWELEPGDISSLVACCPNLRCLSRPNKGAAAGVGRISTSELQQLLQLTALSTFSTRIPSWGTAAVTVLADMTSGCMAVSLFKLQQCWSTAQMPLACLLSCFKHAASTTWVLQPLFHMLTLALFRLAGQLHKAATTLDAVCCL